MYNLRDRGVADVLPGVNGLNAMAFNTNLENLVFIKLFDWGTEF